MLVFWWSCVFQTQVIHHCINTLRAGVRYIRTLISA